MDWKQVNERRNENQLSFVIWCAYIRCFTVLKTYVVHVRLQWFNIIDNFDLIWSNKMSGHNLDLFIDWKVDI